VLHGHQFTNNEEVKYAMHTWFYTQPKKFFTNDIKKLMDQGNKCVEKLEDYIEK
jgi:hypothetical protein